MKKVQLITDGSCIGNPGPGGWAWILRYEGQQRELTGCNPQTTNNRMELTAAVQGLRALKEGCMIELITDSQYLKQGITQFLARWRANGWLASSGRPVLNQDLWQELDTLASQHNIHWSWVAGHGTHSEQNRCDALALTAARQQAARAEAL